MYYRPIVGLGYILLPLGRLICMTLILWPLGRLRCMTLMLSPLGRLICMYEHCLLVALKVCMPVAL